VINTIRTMFEWLDTHNLDYVQGHWNDGKVTIMAQPASPDVWYQGPRLIVGVNEDGVLQVSVSERNTEHDPTQYTDWENLHDALDTHVPERFL